MEIDSFGNIVTNIRKEHLDVMNIKTNDILLVSIGNREFPIPFRSTYSDELAGNTLILVGSSNYVEISVNQAYANRLFNCKIGDIIKISKIKKNY